MDIIHIINTALKILTILGLAAGTAFLGLQILIRALEHRRRDDQA